VPKRVGPVMEEVKTNQGPGEGKNTMATPLRPTDRYEAPAGKTKAAQRATTVMKAVKSKMKVNDAA
jgi:hypothetical protein